MKHPRLVWFLAGLVCWACAAVCIRNALYLGGSDPTWDRISEAGVMRVCMEAAYPPFGMTDAAGAFSGFDVDLANELAGRWGVRAEFVNVHFDGLYDALLAGKCDMILSALPYDETLTEDVIYSPSYFNAGLLLAVRQEERRIRGVNQLGGKRVAVELGSAAELEARHHLEQGRIPLEIVTCPGAQEALQALHDGEVDAAIADSVNVYHFARESGGIRYIKRFLSDEQYVIAVRPGSGYTWKRIADELARLTRQGFLKTLQQRWF
jgi:ABC-type amino acid transport substrate-binding protein